LRRSSFRFEVVTEVKMNPSQTSSQRMIHMNKIGFNLFFFFFFFFFFSLIITQKKNKKKKKQ